MKVSSFRTRAAICAAGAAVVGALTVAVAPTAQAQNQWGGIATGPNGRWVIWWNYSDQNSAVYFGNWAGCATTAPDGTTALCRRVLLFTDCGALAYNGTAFSAAEGANQADAEGAATSDLPGCSIVASACNDGGPQGKRTSY
jgi:hypothetical protein